METNERGRRRERWLVGVAALAVVIGAACQPVVPVPPAPVGNPSVPPAPAVAKATCPSGGTITVSTTIVADVRALLAAAKADKVTLCGSGYRDRTRQIELRKQNCGTTQYDIWEKPSSRCTPPTAIPGTSMHEKGLAIDFSSCSTRTTACYTWLAANARRFGLSNLPSEPWHWSTNGRSRTGADHAHEHGPDV